MQSTWGHTSPFGCQARSTPRWYQEIWSGRALTSLTRLAKFFFFSLTRLAKIFKAVFKIFRIWAFLILTKLARNFSDWLNWQKLCNLSDFVHGSLLMKCLWREFSMFIFSFLLNFSLKLLKRTFSAETMGAYVTRGKWILLRMFNINAFKHHLTIKGL